jgi:hypothetical protein
VRCCSNECNACLFFHKLNILTLLIYLYIGIIFNLKLQINAWSLLKIEQENNIDHNIENENELADWFIENKIIEYLFGPNLHVEVIF